jgi:hypothetical protein
MGLVAQLQVTVFVHSLLQTLPIVEYVVRAFHLADFIVAVFKLMTAGEEGRKSFNDGHRFGKWLALTELLKLTDKRDFLVCQD